MVPLSIDIPVDSPTKPVIRLHSPSAAKSHRWNPKVFEEESMSDILQQTHDISSLIGWLYKRMIGADSYLVEHGSKRSRNNMENDDSDDNNNTKSMKMEIDE
jgi:hypothetical protein